MISAILLARFLSHASFDVVGDSSGLSLPILVLMARIAAITSGSSAIFMTWGQSGKVIGFDAEVESGASLHAKGGPLIGSRSLNWQAPVLLSRQLFTRFI